MKNLKKLALILIFVGFGVYGQNPAKFKSGVDVKEVIEHDFSGFPEDISLDSTVTWDGLRLRWARWQNMYDKIFTSSTAGAGTTSGGQFQNAVVLNGQIYTSSDFGVTWTARDSNREWTGVGISADGQYQGAADRVGTLYTSSDFGVTWISRESSRDWTDIDVSGDGQYMTAVGGTGVGVDQQIYTSSDFGVNWTGRDSNRAWEWVSISSTGEYQSAVEFTGTPNIGAIYVSTNFGVTWTSELTGGAFSAVGVSGDGKYVAATDIADGTGGQIFVSSDFGQNFTPRDSNRIWESVSVSGDGQYMIACVSSGQIYNSSNFGVTWTARDSNRLWNDVGISGSGQYQTAVVLNGQVYESSNFGVTWTARDSNRVWMNVSVGSAFAGTQNGGIPTGSVGKTELNVELKSKISLGNVSGVVNIDALLGIHYTMNMTGNVTNLTFSNLTNEELKTITLEITSDCGSYTFFQPTSIKGDWSSFDSTLTNQIQLYMYDISTPLFTSGFFNF